MSKPRPVTQVPGDRQVWPLYYAERTFAPRPRYAPALTVERAHRVIETVRKWYRLPKIKFYTVNKPRWNETASIRTGETPAKEICDIEIRYNIGRRKIMLEYLLHELAHVVTDHCYGITDPALEPHGREFAGAATYLYDRFHVIPEDALRVLWRRHGVRAKTAVESSPRALLTLRRRRLQRKQIC